MKHILLFLSEKALAQIFNGGGLQSGLQQAANAAPISGDDPKSVIISILTTILDFVGLLAVASIIIAGIYMIVSAGNDEQIGKAKKIIKYTLIGLAVILFARIIVGLVPALLTGN